MSSGPTTSWKTEYLEQSGGYSISAWRYADLAVWHVKISRHGRTQLENAYLVAAGEFYPQASQEAERHAVLHQIAVWENEIVQGKRRV